MYPHLLSNILWRLALVYYNSPVPTILQKIIIVFFSDPQWPVRNFLFFQIHVEVMSGHIAHWPGSQRYWSQPNHKEQPLKNGGGVKKQPLTTPSPTPQQQTFKQLPGNREQWNWTYKLNKYSINLTIYSYDNLFLCNDSQIVK